MGVLDMGEQFAPLAHQVQAPAQQVASRSHLGRVDVGHGHHASSEKTRDFTRIDAVALGFPTVDGPHVEGMAQHEGDLLALAESEGKAMAACHYGGSLGPPAYFRRELFPRLGGLVGDRGAKALLVEDPAAVARLDFSDGELDVDTPEDYRRALSALATRQT